MEYRSTGRSGLKVSEIALGSWMTDLAGSDKARVAEETIRLAYDKVLISLIVRMRTAEVRRRGFLGEYLKIIQEAAM